MDYNDETAMRVGYYVMFCEPEHLEEVLAAIQARKETIMEEWQNHRDAEKLQCFSDLVRSNHASMVNRVKKWKGGYY